MRAGAARTIRVGWAGSTRPREPHYFRIQGANFLIEFDNSGGNHIHSVWRDFDGDFGRDVLREHYRRRRRQPWAWHPLSGVAAAAPARPTEA